jgi:hypothetical protein
MQEGIPVSAEFAREMVAQYQLRRETEELAEVKNEILRAAGSGRPFCFVHSPLLVNTELVLQTHGFTIGYLNDKTRIEWGFPSKQNTK